jgi:hypothetical protein
MKYSVEIRNGIIFNFNIHLPSFLCFFYNLILFRSSFFKAINSNIYLARGTFQTYSCHLPNYVIITIPWNWRENDTRHTRIHKSVTHKNSYKLSPIWLEFYELINELTQFN